MAKLVTFDRQPWGRWTYVTVIMPLGRFTLRYPTRKVFTR